MRKVGFSFFGLLLMVHHAFALPASCTTPVKTCVVPGGTRVISGIKVTLPCWQYQEIYTCGTTPVDTCQAYENTCQRGAIDQCLVQIQGYCVKLSRTYECPTKQCDDHTLYCAQHVFCSDGKCVKQTPTQNKDFGGAASELAGAANAAKEAVPQQNNGQSINVFTGQHQECSIALLNYQDCCKDSGWGKNTGLAKCSDSEKKLGSDKEHYLTTYVGSYCAHRTLTVCTSTHKVYCVYTSKLARIIADYGRAQLHKSYGGAEHADCSGFTMEEFQKLNFNLMDFVDPIYIYPNGSHNTSAGVANDQSISGPSANDMANSINKQIQNDINNHSAGPGQVPNLNALANAVRKQVEGQG
jgi:conjugal transfer mating pair stabilization protein TraN